MSDVGAIRSVSPLCPRCEQGQVFPARITATRERVQVCEECDATWHATEILTAVPFRDLETLLRERGLSPRWDELEVSGLTCLRPDASVIRNGSLPQPAALEPELVLPADFDDHAWEVEAKGCFLDATVRWSGRDFLVSFYDPVRLAQDVEADVEQAGRVELERVVVVRRVTRDALEAAARALPSSFFDAITP